MISSCISTGIFSQISSDPNAVFSRKVAPGAASWRTLIWSTNCGWWQATKLAFEIR